MTGPRTEAELSDQFDNDLIWRRKELSDLKAAIRLADSTAVSPLLRALITLCYAHWEGYVRYCARRYFGYVALRKIPYENLERQIYINSFLIRIDAMAKSRQGVKARCDLVNAILDGETARFSFINEELIDTRSNLNTDTVKDICSICSIDDSYFEDRRPFIDVILLKRRNAIAHGQPENIDASDVDDTIADTLSLMEHFRNLLENKVYQKAYLAA